MFCYKFSVKKKIN